MEGQGHRGAAPVGDAQQPYVTIRSRRPAGEGARASSADSTYGSGSSDTFSPSATHDTSRVNYHVKHLDSFAQTLQESASRAFPNRNRHSQRYQKVQALLLHWKSDDLFVLPELEDLEKVLHDDYHYETDIFGIPSENAHLELMLKVGAMIKDHESTDTLFVIYYGGHAKIDESRQSTWCATRSKDSSWLQWSAIQTLLERSQSDVLILLDCCAGAASATFPSGQSITETISASSWDAIAPHPGRYSFTSALIEVLQEWRMRTFSAAMLHAEVLARLKHPRPETINGKYYEARSTPVHFMMTSNHKAASIELTPVVPDNKRPPSPPQDSPELPNAVPAGRAPGETEVAEPNEDEPHVMISLALEDNQRLDLNAWEQWLSSFPALAKYVKVQGVFKSHSTLLLLSVPVMIWDLLPEDRACSFVAFIRSNNLLAKKSQAQDAIPSEVAAVEQLDLDTQSVLTGTTFLPGEDASLLSPTDQRLGSRRGLLPSARQAQSASTESLPGLNRSRPLADAMNNMRNPVNARAAGSTVSLGSLQRQHSAPANQPGGTSSQQHAPQHPIMNTTRSQRRVDYTSERDVPSGPPLAAHVVMRAEQYYQMTPNPSVAESEHYASNLGIEKKDLDRWFHYRRLRDVTVSNLQNLKMEDNPPDPGDGIRMVLPHHLSRLLDIMLPDQALVLDLRSRTAFTKSHIYKAVNFCLPSYFIESAEADLIGQALADQEQHDVARWMNAACIIFYDRAVEYSWESPAAESLITKFRRKGWSGQGFLLKGHYREFASSYEKYIVTSSDDGHAKSLDVSLKYSNNDDWRAQQREYQEWLHVLEISDRVHTTELAPPQKQERLDAIAQRERDIDSEFMDRHPQLYKEAQKLRPATQDDAGQQSATPGKGKDIDINLDAQANLVAPLARSLAKMQDATSSSASAARAASPEMRRQYVDKLGEVAKAPEDYEPSSAQDQQNPSLMRSGSVASEGAAPSDGKAEVKEERPFWKRKKSAKSVKEMGSSSWSLRK